MGSCQPCNRNTERRAGNIVDTELVTQMYRFRIAAMLTANTNFQTRTCFSSFVDRNLHQTAYTLGVNAGEGVIFKKTGLKIMHQESGFGIIPGDAISGLSEVVGAE